MVRVYFSLINRSKTKYLHAAHRAVVNEKMIKVKNEKKTTKKHVIILEYYSIYNSFSNKQSTK